MKRREWNELEASSRRLNNTLSFVHERARTATKILLHRPRPMEGQSPAFESESSEPPANGSAGQRAGSVSEFGVRGRHSSMPADLLLTLTSYETPTAAIPQRPRHAAADARDDGALERASIAAPRGQSWTVGTAATPAAIPSRATPSSSTAEGSRLPGLVDRTHPYMRRSP